MTYTQWLKDFSTKRKTILKKLKNLSQKEIIEYFVFENMVEKEPDFCLLYKEKKKCHNVEYLNCLFCACPHFSFNDKGLRKEGDVIVKSECKIDSKNGGKFVYENVEHQDCSNCHVPHTKQFVTKNITSLIDSLK